MLITTGLFDRPYRRNVSGRAIHPSLFQTGL